MISISGTKAAPDFEKEIEISCVSSEFDTKFRSYDFKYDQNIEQNDMEKIKNLIGSQDKLILFFLGHEDKLRSYRKY